jgi:hypothetical protein
MLPQRHEPFSIEFPPLVCRRPSVYPVPRRMGRALAKPIVSVRWVSAPCASTHPTSAYHPNKNLDSPLHGNDRTKAAGNKISAPAYRL